MLQTRCSTICGHGLHHTRWPDQVPGIGWGQGTELDWLRHLVSYWANEFDCVAWERKLNAPQPIHLGRHPLRATSAPHSPWCAAHPHARLGPAVSWTTWTCCRCSRTSTWSCPRCPGMDSRRAPEVGINYRYVSERWHRLMTELGYSRYGAGGNDFGSGVSTFLAVDHPESMMGIHLTTLESDLAPRWTTRKLSDMERSYLAVSRGWDVTERGYKRDPVHQAGRPSAMD